CRFQFVQHGLCRCVAAQQKHLYWFSRQFRTQLVPRPTSECEFTPQQQFERTRTQPATCRDQHVTLFQRQRQQRRRRVHHVLIRAGEPVRIPHDEETTPARTERLQRNFLPRQRDTRRRSTGFITQRIELWAQRFVHPVRNVWTRVQRIPHIVE